MLGHPLPEAIREDTFEVQFMKYSNIDCKGVMLQLHSKFPVLKNLLILVSVDTEA